MPRKILLHAISTVMLLVAASAAAAPNVAVTLSDLAPIVRAVGGETVKIDVLMPAGADPHGFALSAAHIQAVERADIVVTGGNHHHMHFEEELLAVIGDTRTVGWQDYSKHGVHLRDIPGFARNPHGFWMDHRNVRAIAHSVADALIHAGMDSSLVAGRLSLFSDELTAASQAFRSMAEEAGVLGDTVIAAIPGVAYIATNAGLHVGHVLLKEGAGFIGGSELVRVSNMLRTGRAIGILCPLSMKDSKPGTVARQLARDTGSRVIYVRFLSDWSESFLAQTYYNTAALTAGAPGAALTGEIRLSGYSVWAIVFAALLGVTATVVVLKASNRPGGGKRNTV